MNKIIICVIILSIALFCSVESYASFIQEEQARSVIMN